ncbi:hypothetical protein BJF92_17130 [Rhizobium rhizosphaerae]|uniref:PilZ domain-containing protein n=1 Tax=Xaviernesmea rhizosphaerae TaxID=1672749 RepID=A0A1Q9AIT7_9HYPH|nr:hypothetical protein [Xaviernesmea rhizosphaerae]OLP55118.1 hypothetical protein BJF92_17130 [Xaviernesmea rhizosphaerae]OQP84380.1 hypothetical protein BTR14_19625 [Xaviernesmea rhizosphaerae]
MYDREVAFPMEDTMNEARIEYTEKGIVHLSSRRCQVIRLSKSGAVLSMPTQFKLPQNFYLEFVSANVPMVGCLTKRVHADNKVEARFLRLLTDRDINRIFVYSTHPNHRGRVLDIYR